MKLNNFVKRFKNGYTVSVKTRPFYYATGDGTDAEVVIIDSDGKWATSRWKGTSEDIVGWQSPEEVNDALVWAENQI